MAKQVIHMLVDDLDGGEADETVTFAMDGVAYEIDLSGKNASEFRKLMERFQSAGTRVGRSGSPAQLQRRPPTSGSGNSNFAANRELNQSIRQWAKKYGMDLAERGRIPQHIVDAFHAGKPPAQAAVQETLPEPEPEPVAEAAPAPVKKTPAKKAAPAADFKAPAATSRRGTRARASA